MESNVTADTLVLSLTPETPASASARRMAGEIRAFQDDKGVHMSFWIGNVPHSMAPSDPKPMIVRDMDHARRWHERYGCGHLFVTTN